MTNDQIRLAALEYRDTLPYSDDPKIRGMFVGGHVGFIDGIEWLLNRLWHKADEVPKRYDTYLCRTKQGCFFIMLYDMKGWHSSHDGDLMEWCDIKDLFLEE